MNRVLSLILMLSFCLSLYACQSSGSSPIESSEDQTQKLIDYNKALDLLDSAEALDSLECYDVMQNAYAILTGLGDFKDVQAILARFEACILEAETLEGKTDYSIYTNDGLLLWSNAGARGAFTCTYTYNNAGQITKKLCTTPQVSYYYSYEYDAEGNMSMEHYSGYTMPNGSYSAESTKHYKDYTYDSNGRLLSKQATLATGDIITYTYTYDNAGRLIQEVWYTVLADEEAAYWKITDSTDTYTYAYDDTGRKTSESHKYQSTKLDGRTSENIWNTTYTYKCGYYYHFN